MSTIILRRQYITDELGNPIGVILSLNEFALVKDILENIFHLPRRSLSQRAS